MPVQHQPWDSIRRQYCWTCYSSGCPCLGAREYYSFTLWWVSSFPAAPPYHHTTYLTCPPHILLYCSAGSLFLWGSSFVWGNFILWGSLFQGSQINWGSLILPGSLIFKPKLQAWSCEATSSIEAALLFYTAPTCQVVRHRHLVRHPYSKYSLTL